MYQAHFGLKSRPFGSKAGGAAVFVGPVQTKTISTLRKSLAVADAVVSVTGLVGVGKTTIVNRALETISPGRMVAWVGRMPLAPDEVLRLLLVGFGIQTQSKSTIHRFAAFRRFQAERAATGMQVAIVVEDALRLGVDALVELEALTAADTGDGTSANIILMGQSGINKLLAAPELARMRQRNRLRQNIEPLTLPEVMGYLKHCIRTAGGDYDAIFDAGVTDIVFACSEGIPRMINTLCENALNAAVENKSRRVSAALMHRVAAETFGYDGPLPDVVPEAVTDAVAAEQRPSPAATEPFVAVVAASNVQDPETAEDDAEIDWESPPVAAEHVEESTDAIDELSNVAADEPDEPDDAPPDEKNEIPAEVSDEDAAAEIVDDPVGPELPLAARNIVVESGRYPESAEAIDAPPQADLPAAPTEETIHDAVSEIDVDDIPELINDTQPELAKLNPADISVKSNAEAELPVLNAADPAADDLQDEETSSTASHERPDTTKAGIISAADDGVDNKSRQDNDEDLDLDAVLSPEVDETNVMRGITPDLDGIAEDARQADGGQLASATNAAPAPVGATQPAEDELPTLSNSMRVNVAQDESKEAETSKDSSTGAEIGAELARAATVAENADAEPEAARPGLINVEAEIDADLAAAGASHETEPVVIAAVESAHDASSEFELSLMETGEQKPDPEQLRAALESAVHEDNGSAPRRTPEQPAPRQNGAGTQASADKKPPPVPEITLDNKLASKQADKKILTEMADAISKANSLEDISDIMAETLFGCEEFDQIAAEVVANPPPGHPSAGKTSDNPSPVRLDDDEMPNAANDAAEAVADKYDPSVLIIGDETLPPLPEYGGLKDSMALRIEMLNAMKQNTRKAPAKAAASPPNPKGPQPEPIEKQIHTSMTQTLEALKLSEVPTGDGDGGKKSKEKKSGGLFSRFKKSS